MKNNQNLFFSPEEKGRAFSDVLKEVQEYISSKYSTLMVEGGSEEVKQQVKRYITKYICDYRITVKGKTQEQLIDDLYTEMAEFSFLTKYIFGTGIEEIDINSWRDIEIQYNDGRCEKLEEHFESPDHAVNVIRRMLHVSGMVLDNASPAVLGHLSKNIRIAVLKTPLVDEDVGIAASIRIVNPQSLKKENFVDGGTATGEMLDFLAECLRYGISICVAGATSSGKTTLAGWLLTTIPDGKRIFTIENGSRDLWHWCLVWKWEQQSYDIPLPSKLTSEQKKELKTIEQRLTDFLEVKRHRKGLLMLPIKHLRKRLSVHPSLGRDL